MIDGFAEFDVTVSGATIHGRTAGHGPPVLLDGRSAADDVTEFSIRARHFMAEEAPEETLGRLVPFLREVCG